MSLRGIGRRSNLISVKKMEIATLPSVARNDWRDYDTGERGSEVGSLSAKKAPFSIRRKALAVKGICCCPDERLLRQGE